MTASLDPRAVHDLSALYGREWQLAQLAADFGRVCSERTFGVSVVHGPSGIGKSALLARFLADPSMRDATVLIARADQYGGNAPYAALVDGMRALVADILGQGEDSVAHWRGRIGTGVADPEMTLALVPELAVLLEGAALHPPQASPDGGGRLAAAVLQLLRAFASAERPLVIVVDDAHWLDPAAVTLLEQVVGMATDLPVMLLIATRSRAAYYRELAVETLSVADLEQMLADTFVCAQPQLEQLGSLVHHKTGGHPYFARQFLQVLADGGLAHHGDSRGEFDFDGIWRRPFTDNMLGLTLQGLIQLPQQLHELLGTIAVRGRAADLALLCDVSGAEPDTLDDRLAPALRADVLARRGGIYVFTHDRLHDAAVPMLEPSRRTRQHYAPVVVLPARARLDGQDRTVSLTIGIALELAHGRFLTGQLDDCAALVRNLLATVPDRFVQAQAQVQCLAVELAVRRGRYREACNIALDACHRTCILLARGDRLEAVREEIERALAFVTHPVRLCECGSDPVRAARCRGLLEDGSAGRQRANGAAVPARAARQRLCRRHVDAALLALALYRHARLPGWR